MGPASCVEEETVWEVGAELVTVRNYMQICISEGDLVITQSKYYRLSASES